MDDEVFDSVTWEDSHIAHRPGPGFKQTNPDADPDADPHEPKWEGYLITAVQDPVKELADTKDAYVSYLVSAKVIPEPLNVLTTLSYRRRT
jgi:sorting nexin-4